MRKKQADRSAQANANQRRPASHTLEAFHQRLRDLCSHHLPSAGHDRTSVAQDQAKQACALAREHGILNVAGITWAEFKKTSVESHFGTEHVVEFSDNRELVIKLTIPPAFGLIPKVLSHPVVNLRDDPSLPAVRQAIEFVPATPLEYLERWIASNEVFGDDVHLTAVIQWADGQASFAISQPQYHGQLATDREIERYFESAYLCKLLWPEAGSPAVAACVAG